MICADVDSGKVERLSRGELPIFEPRLQEIVDEATRAGRLNFVLGAATAARHCEFTYLCVPVPQGADGSADLRFIEQASREIAPVLPSEAIVVNKSTVPVGSTKVVERALKRPDVRVVSNPEFLREGSAINDFLKPDRIVIGSEDQAAAIRVASLYLGITAPLILTDPASAEAIKYTTNAFLATKVSFVNAVAAICEAVGADINDVVLGVGYDKRIGHEFLRPGPGWGGSCLPKDTLAMVKMAEDSGYQFDLLKGVIAVNDDQRARILAKVERAVGRDLERATLAVWGLAFKANTDDLRDSPALAIVSELASRGANVRAHDPTVRGSLDGFECSDDPYDVCDGADALVVLTEWDQFRWLDLSEAGRRMASRAIVDARNLLDRASAVRTGFEYYCVGR